MLAGNPYTPTAPHGVFTTGTHTSTSTATNAPLRLQRRAASWGTAWQKPEGVDLNTWNTTVSTVAEELNEDG